MTGGATLDANRQSAQLIITQNDSPLRFAQTAYSFNENRGTVTVTVYRSLSEDGLRTVGPTNGVVTVEYWFQSEGAGRGSDYVATNGSLQFSTGEQRKDISFAILEDIRPELGEQFVILLMNPSSNAVLADPSETVVTILPNDDQHGVLSLDSNPPGSGIPPTVIVNEDTTAVTSDFVIVRNGGTFGAVSVMYEITRNDSNSVDIVDTDIRPARGLVTLIEGQTSKAIPLLIEQDIIPEEAELYHIRLIPETVTGGARVAGITSGTLIVADSDHAYGVIQFSSDSDQSIVSDSVPRKIQLSITRGQGTIGNVVVNYTVSYSTPDGVILDITGKMP